MRWYTADFDNMSWQDVHVHGFRIVESGEGMAELTLDIDFIFEGPGHGSEHDGFRVAQAILQFHDVFALRFSLDYVVCSAMMSAFSIDRIDREPLREIGDEDDDHGPWRWRIGVNWPEGLLEFEASGFSQWLVGDVVDHDTPSLSASLRM